MPDRVFAEAPGRVNLIGEHTDYHEGFVLPTIIPQRTRVAMTRRTGHTVRVRSGALGAAEFDIGRERAGRGWIDYVQGITAVLNREGITIPGCDIDIASDIPVGAGVSSSAALIVAILRGFRALLTLDFDDVRLAVLAREVETDFVGAPVGIMDQMAVSLCRQGAALFLDTRSLVHRTLQLPESSQLIVIDTGVTHQHAGGGYVTRREESFAAAAKLGMRVLRDIPAADLAIVESLPAPLNRRARHVITENQRVLDAVTALDHGDAIRLGRLFNASHASLRDDYEVSVPDVDRMVSIGQRHPRIYGARMTGGGFGGAVVMLAHADAAAATANAIRDEYLSGGHRVATVLVPRVA